MAVSSRSLWAHRDFLRLWLAQILSLVGTQFGGLALPLVAILVLHASAPQVGVLTGLAGLPWLLIGLFVGVGVDRCLRWPTSDAGSHSLGCQWAPRSGCYGSSSCVWSHSSSGRSRCSSKPPTSPTCPPSWVDASSCSSEARLVRQRRRGGKPHAADAEPAAPGCVFEGSAARIRRHARRGQG